MSNPEIVIKNISKNFNGTSALADITIEVEQDEIFGVIGPDGSGKTTLFRILATLLVPDKGEAYIKNLNAVKNFREIRNIIGYMPGRFSLYQDLTVEENLSFFAVIYDTDIKKHYDIIKDVYVQLEPFKTRRAGNLSGGMKQKLALCCALIHKPDILLLDEPTTGVDAVSRQEFWQILKKLSGQGITVMVSTPYMDEAAKCDRIALIEQGQVLGIDSPEIMRQKFNVPIYSVKCSDNYRAMLDLRKFESAESVYPCGDSLHYISSAEDMRNINEKLKGYLTGKGYQNIIVKKIKPDIEDIFIELMSGKNERRDNKS